MLSSMSEGKVRGLVDILSSEAAETLNPELALIKQFFDAANQEAEDGKWTCLYIFVTFL